jgi:hypothetical protein
VSSWFLSLTGVLIPGKQVSLDRLTPESISIESLHSDYSEYRSVGQQIRRSKRQSRRMPLHCNCRNAVKTTAHLRWPISLQTTRTTHHARDCPCARQGDTEWELNLRFSVCFWAFRRKVQLAFAVAQVAGVSKIAPSLIHYPVVPESSPAFRLFANTIFDDWSELTFYQRDLAYNNHLKDAATRLPRMFARGEASPYDRTPMACLCSTYVCPLSVVS